MTAPSWLRWIADFTRGKSSWDLCLFGAFLDFAYVPNNSWNPKHAACVINNRGPGGRHFVYLVLALSPFVLHIYLLRRRGAYDKWLASHV